MQLKTMDGVTVGYKMADSNVSAREESRNKAVCHLWLDEVQHDRGSFSGRFLNMFDAHSDVKCGLPVANG
jgi:hypothetical protein